MPLKRRPHKFGARRMHARGRRGISTAAGVSPPSQHQTRSSHSARSAALLHTLPPSCPAHLATSHLAVACGRHLNAASAKSRLENDRWSPFQALNHRDPPFKSSDSGTFLPQHVALARSATFYPTINAIIRVNTAPSTSLRSNNNAGCHTPCAEGRSGKSIHACDPVF